MDKVSIIEELKKFHTEELNDHAKYMEMAKKCEAMPDMPFSGIFKDMANEEETHAMFIERMIDELK